MMYLGINITLHGNQNLWKSHNINTKAGEMGNKVYLEKNFFFCSIAEFGFYMIFQNDTLVLLAKRSTTETEHLLHTRTEHLKTPLSWPNQPR